MKSKLAFVKLFIEAPRVFGRSGKEILQLTRVYCLGQGRFSELRGPIIKRMARPYSTKVRIDIRLYFVCSMLVFNEKNKMIDIAKF